MDKRPTSIIHATGSSSLADVLERILDKGVVVAGDITVKIVDIELLTIQVRLLVCSVDKAREIGMSWWTSGSFVGAPAPASAALSAPVATPAGTATAASTVASTAASTAPMITSGELAALNERMRHLERMLARLVPDNGEVA